MLLGALVGIPAAVGGYLLLQLVRLLETWLWTTLPKSLGHDEPPWFLIVGLPVIGAGLVLLAARYLPGGGGHEPLDGIQLTSTPLSHVPGIVLATFGSLSFGAVLGPEGPLIALGSAIGLAVQHRFTLTPREQRVMATAGSFAAIAALFGGPLVASFMLIEAASGLGSLLLPTLVPGLVAAAVGWLVFVGIGSWVGLPPTSLDVPDLPVYDQVRISDLFLAVVAGVVILLILRLARRVAEAVRRLHRRRGAVVLLGGGLVVGLLALLATPVGVRSDEILFSGQTAVPVVVATTSAGAVFVVLTFKALAYAVCLGCGFKGGPVFPAILIGIAVMSFAVIWFDVSPTLAIAVGAAAGMASMTSLVFTAILFAALLTGTGGLDAVPVSVLAAASAWLAGQFLDSLGKSGASPSTTELGRARLSFATRGFPSRRPDDDG